MSKLNEIMQDFFIKYRGKINKQNVAELIQLCNDENISMEELISPLLSFIDVHHNWYSSRSQSEGGGRVKKVDFKRDYMKIETWGNKEFEFTYEKGFRWRIQQGWVSRNSVEEALNVWPGYIDALEDLFKAIMNKIYDLEREKEENAEKFRELWDKAYDYLQQQFSLERHPTLKLWRNRSKVTCEIPECLKDIRHIKRLEISEPAYVYFLIKVEEVVNVGQTTSPWPSRILRHLNDKDKDFDDVWYLKVDRPSINEVERAFIKKYRPKYNRSGYIRTG